MTKKKCKPKPVNWVGRLKSAHEQGYFDGYGDGCEATHMIWTQICERAKGIGPKTQAKLLETAQQMMRERTAAKFKNRVEGIALAEMAKEAMDGNQNS